MTLKSDGFSMTRRSFLASAAAAGAFAIVPGAVFAKGAASQKVRLACVGIGHQAWNDIQ